MAARKRRRRGGRAAKPSEISAGASSPADHSPAALPLPELAQSIGSSDDAIAALERSADEPAPEHTSDSPTSGDALTGSATATAHNVSAETTARDRSEPAKAAPTSEKKTKRDDRPKPIALEAKELRGLQVAELRALLVAERRRNTELTERLEKESPIAQAALDEDLQQGIAETFTLASEGIAFVLDEKDAKLPATTAERLGRVWAPIAKRYLGEHADKIPIGIAIVATLEAIVERAAAVKEARELRAELEALRAKHGEGEGTPLVKAA